MKTSLYDLNAKEIGKLDLPLCFSSKDREDLVAKVLESKKKQQPYAPSLIAGNQSSASGLIIHRRHVWKSQYGRGMSRVPRKALSIKGSQFNWVAAIVPNARKGRRAHPPKVASRLNELKLNKKELKLALMSAIASTANINKILKKYSTLEKSSLKQVPFVVDFKDENIKVKQLIFLVKSLYGEEILNVALKKKSIRSGRGKMRDRKYKSNAGLLFVVDKSEKLKTNRFDVCFVQNLSVNKLAKGGQGRLVIYSKKAIEELDKKFSEVKK